MKHQLNIALKLYPITMSFFKTPLLKQFIWEIFFNMIHPSPFLQGWTYETYNSTVSLFITYELNDILSALSSIRIYYILKQYFSSTSYMSLKMQRLMRMFTSSDVNLLFSLKCYILLKPTQFLIMSFLGSMIVFPFLIMIFERPIAAISSNTQLENWDDSIWFSIITMTTSKYLRKKGLILSRVW